MIAASLRCSRATGSPRIYGEGGVVAAIGRRAMLCWSGSSCQLGHTSPCLRDDLPALQPTGFALMIGDGKDHPHGKLATMGGELSARFVSGLTWLANYGTERYSERTARRLRQTNTFNGIVVILYGLFAVFYALLDWQALQPLVMAIVATMPLLVIPPLLHRLNDYAAMVSIAVINGVALVLYAYMVGSAAGLHFFLFAAPAAIVFFGPSSCANCGIHKCLHLSRVSLR